MSCENHRKTHVMEIPRDAEGIFRSRPNRFLAVVDVLEEGGTVLPGERVHVHDPGRLEEILVPGARVLLRRAPAGSSRKTAWDLVAGYHEGKPVLIHSGFHRAISEAVLRSADMNPLGKWKEMRAEVTTGHSRIDFLLTLDDGSELWVEVKGCTLAVDGKALFPDAPTEGGRRHLETLMELVKKGETSGKKEKTGAVLVILVFRSEAECFAPNAATDPKFAETFYTAMENGLGVHPLVFECDGKDLYYLKEIPICSE